MLSHELRSKLNLFLKQLLFILSISVVMVPVQWRALHPDISSLPVSRPDLKGLGDSSNPFFPQFGSLSNSPPFSPNHPLLVFLSHIFLVSDRFVQFIPSVILRESREFFVQFLFEYNLFRLDLFIIFFFLRRDIFYEGRHFLKLLLLINITLKCYFRRRLLLEHLRQHSCKVLIWFFITKFRLLICHLLLGDDTILHQNLLYFLHTVCQEYSFSEDDFKKFSPQLIWLLLKSFKLLLFLFSLLQRCQRTASSRQLVGGLFVRTRAFVIITGFFLLFFILVSEHVHWQYLRH